METVTESETGVSPTTPIREAAAPGQSQSEIDAKIRDAGYDPYPSSDAVSTDLYRERLTTWLNRTAGVAFIDDQSPTDDYVRVRFELPYGGTFTQEFARPDSTYTTQVSYPELVATADRDFKTLTELRHAEIPIMREDSEWRVDYTRLTTPDNPDFGPQRQTNRRRRGIRAVLLGANRIIIPPLLTGLAFLSTLTSDIVPATVSTIALPLLILIVAFEILQFFVVTYTGYDLRNDIAVRDN